MKRKVLYGVSLVAWVLVACTLISFKIEEQMTAQVVTVRGSFFESVLLPMESLSYDETGFHLFEMAEETGWESGLRARELGNRSYTIINDEENDTQQVLASPSYNGELIRFSSRPLQNGEPLVVVTGQARADDVYLAIFPETVPALDSLTASLKLESRTDTALLLSASNADQPFLETRIRSQLYQVTELRPYIQPMTAAETRIYSLPAVERFMQNLPRLALLAILLLFPVALWAASLILSQSRKIALFNAAMTAVDAVLIPKVLSRVDLPSSLLPADMFFDFGHCTRQFRQIFSALKTFGNNQIAQSTLQIAKNAQHTAVMILLAGILLVILVIAAACVICHIAKSPRCKPLIAP